MWSYYGAKTNLVRLYPKPKYDTIIEPFAGSARYALHYFDRSVILIDKYPVIVKIWKWLQQCSEKDILKLPRRMNETDRLENIQFDCEAARLFMGFIVGCGAQSPRNKLTARKTTDRPNHINYNLQRVAKNLFKIKHWQIIEGDYKEAPDREATWFIDPPYQFGGEVYVKSNKHISFNDLAEWSRNRKGQVIVCENTKADWMDFSPMVAQKGSTHTTTEAIWSNEKTAYDARQQKMFV
jgi:site-specific DNA-adenine methylase